MRAGKKGDFRNTSSRAGEFLNPLESLHSDGILAVRSSSSGRFITAYLAVLTRHLLALSTGRGRNVAPVILWGVSVL